LWLPLGDATTLSGRWGISNTRHISGREMLERSYTNLRVLENTLERWIGWIAPKFPLSIRVQRMLYSKYNF